MKKILLIILVLLIAGLAYIYINKDKIAQVAIEKSIPLIESSLEGNMPADVDRDEVKAVFAAVNEKVKAGKIDIMQVQGLLTDFKDAMDDKKLDEKEFHKLYDKMKKLAEQ